MKFSTTCSTVLLVLCLSVIDLNVFSDTSERQAHAFNLNDFLLNDLGEIFNMVNNMELSAPSLTKVFQRVVKRCKKNNVQLDLKAIVDSYVCLGAIDNSGSKAADPDSFFDKACTKWPETEDCVKPLFSQLELCFSSEMFQLEGAFIEIVKLIKEPMCADEDVLTTGFFNTILVDGPLTMTCLLNHTTVIISDSVECFGKASSSSKLSDTSNNITESKEDSQGICQNFDAYLDCFIKSLDICNDRRVEKLVYNILEKMGFKKIISKYIVKCTS